MGVEALRTMPSGYAVPAYRGSEFGPSVRLLISVAKGVPVDGWIARGNGKYSALAYAYRPRRRVRPNMTLVLDLDETLVHASKYPMEHWEFELDIEIETTRCTLYAVRRPGLHAFLAALYPHFEIAIYTASRQEYADRMIDYMEARTGFLGLAVRVTKDGLYLYCRADLVRSFVIEVVNDSKYSGRKRKTTW